MPSHELVMGRTSWRRGSQAEPPKATKPVQGRTGWGEYTLAGGGMGRPNAKASATRSVSNPELGMVLVAFDAKNGPTPVKSKWDNTWLKLAQQARLRSGLPGRARRAVAAALEEHRDAVISRLKDIVQEQLE